MTKFTTESLFIDPLSGKKPVMSHAFYTRHGGKSATPFATNNMSFGVGDREENVLMNRDAIKKRLGVDILLSAHQVHGDTIFLDLDGSIHQDTEIEGCDALITDREGVGLMIQQADCQAVLLYDPITQSIAAVHCGWRGSVVGIIGKTIATMERSLGVQPENLVVAVSPSLGPCCGEFVNYRQELPESFHAFEIGEKYFDFWQITRWQLEQAGVQKKAIFVAGVCTSCSTDYFSYRRACRESNGVTGRNCSVITLVPSS